jgi:aromatic ring hydroxylase
MSDDSHQKIVTGEDYIDSLRGRKLKVFLMGEQVDEPALTIR